MKPFRGPVPKPEPRQPKGRRRLPDASPKRRRARSQRQMVRVAVLKRDGHCRAPGMGAPGRCWGPLDVHEPRGGSERSLSWLDVDACLLVCRFHHDWTHANPRAAYALGLLLRSTT